MQCEPALSVHKPKWLLDEWVLDILKFLGLDLTQPF